MENKPCPRIGITGGIGSGKSTVCQIFETLGIPVYDADDRAKQLIVNDPHLVRGIRQLFGDNAYGEDGSYNRAYVAQIVFDQKDKVQALNALVHPAVEEDSRKWHLEQAEKGAPYTLREAALLIESGNYKALDAVILVTAPEEIRIRRVMARDHSEAAKVRKRVANQMTDEAKAPFARFVILNDGAHALIPQVLDVHRKILSGSF